jgi:hypothetical protein
MRLSALIIRITGSFRIGRPISANRPARHDALSALRLGVKNKLNAQRARTAAYRYVIFRELMAGMSAKAVNWVPKTFPIVEIP